MQERGSNHLKERPKTFVFGMEIWGHQKTTVIVQIVYHTLDVIYIYIYIFSISYVYCTLNIEFYILTIILTSFSCKLALFWQHMIFAIPQELGIVVWNLDPHGLRRKTGIWLRRNTAMVGFECVLRLETNGK